MKLLPVLGMALLVSTASIPAQQKTSSSQPTQRKAGQPPTTQTAQPRPDGTLAPVVSDIVAAQVLLDRAGFSTGEIDGEMGANVKRALAAFQQANGVQPSGQLDEPTWQKLKDATGNVPPLATYTISATDVAGPFTPGIPADMLAKAKLDALGYQDAAEALAEKFHVRPALLGKINPGTSLDKAGSPIMVPNVEPFDWTQVSRDEDARARGTQGARATSGRGEAPQPARGGNQGRATPQQPPRAAQNTRGNAGGRNSDQASASAPAPEVTIYVTKSTSALTVEENGRVIFHAPVTSGSTHDPLPIGRWKVTGVQRNPAFHYNPDLFWDAEPGHSKATIKPGPNNPVGVAWIDLSKEHYGIHGTPEPSQIGHVQSHGCVRLTNWDVARVSQWVRPGTPVIFRE